MTTVCARKVAHGKNSIVYCSSRAVVEYRSITCFGTNIKELLCGWAMGRLSETFISIQFLGHEGIKNRGLKNINNGEQHFKPTALL